MKQDLFFKEENGEVICEFSDEFAKTLPAIFSFKEMMMQYMKFCNEKEKNAKNEEG